MTVEYLYSYTVYLLLASKRLLFYALNYGSPLSASTTGKLFLVFSILKHQICLLRVHVCVLGVFELNKTDVNVCDVP